MHVFLQLLFTLLLLSQQIWIKSNPEFPPVSPKLVETPDFEWAIKPRFKAVKPFSYGLAAFKFNHKWGYINKKGKVVIEAQFDKAESFYHKGFGGKEIDAWVELKGERFLIDRKGKKVGTKYDYQVMRRVKHDREKTSEGMIGFQQGKHWGFMDKKGKILVRPAFEEIRAFSLGLAQVKKEGKWGVVDRKGRVVVNFEYDYLSFFFNGFARVQKKGKWGFIDRTGKIIIPIRYEALQAFSGDIALFKQNDKWGYINRQGIIRIKAQFDNANNFSEGLAQVQLGEQCGFINRKGEMVIRPQFDAGRLMFSFSDRLCPVKYHGKWGFIKHPLDIKQKKKRKK